jgi:hypothetical protein
MNNIEDSKMFTRSQRNTGEKTESKETLVFCTPESTAVWVNKNTREDIFKGISRNEYYDTSGPLIRVRFFGGWDFPADMTKDPDFIKKAYKSGVPMGGEIKAKPKNAKSLTFAVWALKDPNSVYLDRIQIIKSWHVNGLNKERIYDVAWSGSRKPDPKTGKLPPVDNTIVLNNAKDKNDIDEGQLSAVWTDPDFDPSEPAVYYARVMEIPSPPRVEYKGKEPGTGTPERVPDTIQERAWTSPITYSPNEKSQ